MPVTYGATVEGVVALAPTVDDGGLSDERRAQIERHIADVAEIVEARVGDLTGESAATVLFLTGKGRAAVHIGATAATVGALYQSGGGRGSSEYADSLWDLFWKMLEIVADAAVAAGAGTPIDPDTGQPVLAGSGLPSGRFPLPTFRSGPSVSFPSGVSVGRAGVYGWPYRR